METIDILLQKALAGKVNFFKLSPKKHQALIDVLSAPNYASPVGFALSVGVGLDDCTLKIQYMDSGRVRETEVLDLQSMYSVHNLGYKNKKIKQTLLKHIESNFPPTARGLNHPYYTQALVKLHEITGMDKFLPKIGGTEAVETACKAAKKFWHLNHKRRDKSTKKDTPKIVAAKDNFHGRSVTPTSLSSDSLAREGFEPLVPGILHIPFNNAGALEKTLKEHRGTVAAVILEPVQGNSKVVPQDDYLLRVQKLCRTYGTLFILDEVQTGFGRVGGTSPDQFFAYQSYGIFPDLMCGGKAAGGGMVPFSFVGGRSEIMDCLDAGTEGATWSGWSLGCDLFCTAASEIRRKSLVVASREKGEYLLRKLEERLVSQYPHAVAGIRGRGLFIRFEIKKTFCTGREFSYALLQEEVWAKEIGQTIHITPPLTIRYEQIDECIRAFERAFKKLEKTR